MFHRLIIVLLAFCFLVSCAGCQFWKNPKDVRGKASQKKELPDPPLYPGPDGKYTSGAQNDDLVRQAELLRRNPDAQQEPTKKPWYKNFGYSSRAAEINDHLGD